MNITILGAGAWGTAIAIAFARHHHVVLWGRESTLIHEAAQSRENRKNLPGHIFPDHLTLTVHFEEAVAHASGPDDLVIIATSVAGLRPVAQQLAQFSITNLLWVCKGFEEVTGAMPHQVLAQELDHHINQGVLSGPSFAQEVAAGLPCALTIASDSAALRKRVIHAANGSAMRVYSSDDVVGVEVGGAIKNIMAIATGMSDGAGLGMNARAALITRGLAEITRLGIALGGRPETFMGLTGMGDLILTCTGDLSRNRRIGLAMAQGKSLDQAVATLGHVAEGVLCASVVSQLADQLGVEMPITKAVVGVLFDSIPIKTMVTQLLSRHMRDEIDDYGRR